MTLQFTPGVQDCPHCMARVMILSDGFCPRCQGSSLDTSSIDPNRTSVWVRETDVMPEICYKCGQPADRKTTIEHTESWTSPNDESGGFAKVPFLSWIFGWIGAFAINRVIKSASKYSSDTRQAQRLAIRIFECPGCAAGEVHAVAADMRHAALRIAVHQHLADEHKRLNNL